jgi:hypothetical protein
VADCQYVPTHRRLQKQGWGDSVIVGPNENITI